MAIQAATAVMMVLKCTYVEPRSATKTASTREPQRQRHGGPALEKPSFTWNGQDMYIKLLNFEIAIMEQS